MRRSQRKIIAWLLLIAVSLNPLVGVHALNAGPVPAIADCQIDLAASAASEPADGAGPITDCSRHHACATSCQFAPLQPSGPQQPRVERRPWPALSGGPENIVTRFLESIERPPRV